jgi:hypothetical protein
VNDELDRALAEGLSSLAPDPDDADAVLVSLRPRLHRARTRHRVARASATAIAVLTIATLTAALGAASTHHRHVSVSATPTTPPRGRSTSASTSMSSSTSIASMSQHTTSTTAAPPAPMVVPVPAGGTPPVSPPGRVGGNSGPAVTTRPPRSMPPSTASAPAIRTYRATGGSVTVRFTNGSLALVSYTSASGYTAEVHDNEPDRVEVRFSDGDHESRIRLQVDNGQIVPEIESS